MNIVVVRGTLSSEPQVRELPSGSTVVSYEVTVRPEEGAAETVPVSWFEAPASASSLASGAEVVVTGRVRRRFFRVGARTGSRTDVVAEAVIPVRRRKQVAMALEAARLTLVDSA